MSTLGGVFVILNVVVSIAYLWNANRSYNAFGRRELGTPGAWLWIWQLLGVVLVISLGRSPWHLIWWFFPVGSIVCYIVGRILVRLGYNPFNQ